MNKYSGFEFNFEKHTRTMKNQLAILLVALFPYNNV